MRVTDRLFHWIVVLVFAVLFLFDIRLAQACSAPGKCDGVWVAAHDVGAVQGFFNRPDGSALVLTYKVGDVLSANRDVNARGAPADWRAPVATLKQNDHIIIEAMQILPITGSQQRQTWLLIHVSPTSIDAAAPISASALPGASRPPVNTKAGIPTEGGLGIWWEHPVAEATGGYDAAKNRTLINSYDLVVTGPSSVQAVVEDVVKHCVQVSAVAGYEAFKAAPSPEVGARLAAAWGGFHAALVGCFQAESVGDELSKKFEIGYIRRGRWEDGLQLKFAAFSPNAEQYRKLHDLVKDKLPDPVNKLVSFYISTQEIPKVDIKLDPPKAVRDVIAVFPDPKELREFIAAADGFGEKEGKRILADVREEAQNAVQRLGDEAAKSPQKVISEGVQLVGKVADDAKKIAPDIVNAFVPQVKDGKISLGGTQVSVTGSGGAQPGPTISITPSAPSPGPICPHPHIECGMFGCWPAC